MKFILFLCLFVQQPLTDSVIVTFESERPSQLCRQINYIVINNWSIYSVWPFPTKENIYRIVIYKNKPQEKDIKNIEKMEGFLSLEKGKELMVTP